MRESDLVAETLGEEVFDFVLRDHEKEWREYQEQITPQEIRRFLKVN
jgi:glutamine synthetase